MKLINPVVTISYKNTCFFPDGKQASKVLKNS